MGQDKGQVGTTVENEEKSPDELRREIEDTRHDLGETAAALAEKTDVKARAREKAEGVKRTVSQKKEQLASKAGGAAGGGSPAATANSVATQAKAKARENPVAAAAVAAFVGGFLAGRIRSR